LYWLEIITDLEIAETEKLKPITMEATELLAIFTSIGNNLNP
jgi:hypothetical protein